MRRNFLRMQEDLCTQYICFKSILKVLIIYNVKNTIYCVFIQFKLLIKTIQLKPLTISHNMITINELEDYK